MNIYCWTILISLGFRYFFSDVINKEDIEIKLIKKPCLHDTKRECDCSRLYLENDSNIYMIESGSESEYKFEDFFYCFKTDLVVYGNKISIDSVYLNNGNKNYIAGFVEGRYIKKGDKITLKLLFINVGINTSRPTNHLYTVTYDTKKKSLSAIKFEYLE